MTYENINFKHQNLCVKDGYFFTFDHEIDALVMKVSDGTIAFTYPLSAVLDTEVLSAEYGGGYFWSLQDNSDFSVLIKKWKIDNYVCVLVSSNVVGDFLDPAGFSEAINDNFDGPGYAPWTKDGPPGSVITVVSGEAIVTSSDFGSTTGWEGPTLTQEMNNMEDFFVECEFKYNMTHQNQRFMFEIALLLPDDTNYLRARAIDPNNGVYSDYGYLYYYDSAVYGNVTAFTMNAYNTVSFSRTGTALSFSINGAEKWTGTVDTVYPSKVVLRFYEWTYSPQFIAANYVTVSGAPVHVIDSDAFTVENYTTTLASGISVSDDGLYIDEHYNTAASGTEVAVGPNTNGEFEYKTVSTVSGGKIYTETPFTTEFVVGANVELDGTVFVFNNASFDSMSDGSLYKFLPSDFSFIEYINDTEYDNILSSTFAKELSGVFSSVTSAVAYVKSTNLKLMDVDNLSNVEFMIMDNIRTDTITVIPVYDVSFGVDTVYRLQDEATYYEVDNAWSTYNYQVSPVRSFVDSMTVDATNKIVNSDGFSIVEILSTVFDQYNNPIFNKLVFFEDDDAFGYMTISPAYTQLNGVAYSYYRAGISPAHVTITATATQND